MHGSQLNLFSADSVQTCSQTQPLLTMLLSLSTTDNTPAIPDDTPASNYSRWCSSSLQLLPLLTTLQLMAFLYDHWSYYCQTSHLWTTQPALLGQHRYTPVKQGLNKPGHQPSCLCNQCIHPFDSLQLCPWLAWQPCSGPPAFWQHPTKDSIYPTTSTPVHTACIIISTPRPTST